MTIGPWSCQSIVPENQLLPREKKEDKGSSSDKRSCLSTKASESRQRIARWVSWDVRYLYDRLSVEAEIIDVEIRKRGSDGTMTQLKLAVP